ncbi:MAG: hypothetical protein IT557_17455 [Alphaproteobacteria bacterium]|nr:hypothetical protein [Alphaproteobacteria bacterium]
MIPQRFVTEYPERCGQLLSMLEPQAREHDLLGSFALLVASAAFNIPFGRITEADHPLGPPESPLSSAIRALEGQPFLEAPFWHGKRPAYFRFSRIMNDPSHAAGWADQAGLHPLQSGAPENGYRVLKVIRHALAHGNVVYLNERGHEAPGERVRFLAFLSRNNRHHRVAIFDEESFLAFLKAWIAWIQEFPPEFEFVFGEAAE